MYDHRQCFIDFNNQFNLQVAIVEENLMEFSRGLYSYLLLAVLTAEDTIVTIEYQLCGTLVSDQCWSVP